ncbi:MAG: hypothetical protein A2Y14_03280 [Verrucomicrobia bacterium GWF2_51_19]|nr:MAG: hypothetical protein A2Y14_03280 [Verrucomicrobia bacterium GWF2_51_19]
MTLYSLIFRLFIGTSSIVYLILLVKSHNIYLSIWEKKHLTERLKFLEDKNKKSTIQQIINFLFEQKLPYGDDEELLGAMKEVVNEIPESGFLVHLNSNSRNDFLKNATDQLYEILTKTSNDYSIVIDVIAQHDALTLHNKITEIVCDDKSELNKLKEAYNAKIDKENKSSKYYHVYSDVSSIKLNGSKKNIRLTRIIEETNRLKNLLSGIRNISIEKKDYYEIQRFFDIARPTIINALLEKIKKIVSDDIFNDVEKILKSVNPVVFDKYALLISRNIVEIEEAINEKYEKETKEEVTNRLTGLLEEIKEIWSLKEN